MTLTVGQCSATQMIVQESNASGQGGTNYIVVYSLPGPVEVTRSSVPITGNSIHKFNLTAGAAYRVSYFSWQGAVIEYVDYIMSNSAPVSTLCSSLPGTVDNSKIIILVVVLVALYFMWKGGMK